MDDVCGSNEACGDNGWGNEVSMMIESVASFPSPSSCCGEVGLSSTNDGTVD